MLIHDTYFYLSHSIAIFTMSYTDIYDIYKLFQYIQNPEMNNINNNIFYVPMYKGEALYKKIFSITVLISIKLSKTFIHE